MAKRRKEENYTENSPFIVRRPYVNLWQMIFLGLFMTIAIYASIYYASEHLRNFIVMFFGILIVILLYFIQNTYFDEKTATEFQSSVYSGAMRSNTMLSFILHQDCGIYYFDQRFLNEFGQSIHFNDFDHIMEKLGIGAKQREKIVEAVAAQKFFEFDHKIFDGEKRCSVVVGVYPIARPRGFSYLSVYKVRD